MNDSSSDHKDKISSMKRVLMIAYHFPPIQGSSGVHRTVQFARHLPSFGWAPIIVAPHPRAYPAIGDDSWAKLPEEAIVKRVFALDSAKHLAVKGRYFGVTAMPDRWVSWWPGGVFECLRLIKKYRPHILWSTFPIATAHLIGLTVNRLTGLPWVADFRDPMVQEGQPASRLNRMVCQRLEKEIVSHSSCCTLVSSSALTDYSKRYPNKISSSWQLIENGYDESLFEPYEFLFDAKVEKNVGQTIKILHSGILYSTGRNPLPFLEAVKSLIKKNKINIDIVFRGCGNEKEVGEHINRLGLVDFVKLLPSISYDMAIKEMIETDVLVLFQGSVYNKQIPAKIYEYIRAKKPILALTDKSGETAKFLQNWDGIYISDMLTQDSIEETLTMLLNDIYTKKKISRNKDKIDMLSRYAGTRKFVEILDHFVKK